MMNPPPTPLRTWLLRLALLAACCVLAFMASAAPFEDTLAQRALACTACHGQEGRAAPDGYYPRIAGKPAGYLYNQLINFREGRRQYGLMNRMLAPLSDAYILEIAQHFAAQDVPYPPPQPANAPPQVLERGKVLVMQGDAARQVPACVQCHGSAMTGVAPDVPGLLGLPRDYLSAQFGAWRTKQRRAHAPDCMAAIAQRLDTGDINAVSAWLASQPVPAHAKAATAAPAWPAGTEPMKCGNASATKGAGR